MSVVIKEIKDCPFARLADHFAGEEDVTILESSMVNALGRFSILGRRPYHRIEEKQGRLWINSVEQPGSFLNYTKNYLQKHREENPTGLPLVSGGMGFFAYDEGEEGTTLPKRLLLFYDQFWIADEKEKRMYFISNQKTQTIEEAKKECKEVLEQIKHTKKQEQGAGEKGALFDFTREEYEAAVREVIRNIIEGEVYIANLTQRLFLKSEEAPYALYQQMRLENPAPFSAYLHQEGYEIVCASPERFLQVRNNEVVTRPIKGTRPRGRTPEEDICMRKELEDSQKDKSELLMIVDLERNDLNRVCIPGSVQVEKLFSIESYATVHHLVAQVRGVLQEDQTVMDLMEAAFPGGSITGAPKQRAMELLEELEHTRRGLYTGSIGYFSLNGDCDWNIVIRTAVWEKDGYTIGVGGGITCESDPIAEYEETLQKAKAFLEAGNKGGQNG